MGVEQGGLVEFPVLKAQGVLDGVAALLPEAMSPGVAFFNEVVAAVAKVI
jgi:hypothetical protein